MPRRSRARRYHALDVPKVFLFRVAKKTMLTLLVATGLVTRDPAMTNPPRCRIVIHMRVNGMEPTAEVLRIIFLLTNAKGPTLDMAAQRFNAVQTFRSRDGPTTTRGHRRRD